VRIVSAVLLRSVLQVGELLPQTLRALQPGVYSAAMQLSNAVPAPAGQ